MSLHHSPATNPLKQQNLPLQARSDADFSTGERRHLEMAMPMQTSPVLANQEVGTHGQPGAGR